MLRSEQESNQSQSEPELVIVIYICKHIKGIYTRVKNYVPWIKKTAADGACIKRKKLKPKGSRFKINRKNGRRRGRGTRRRRRRGRKERRKSG